MRVFVFDFEDYKAYLHEFGQALPKRGYGFKSRLAEAASCRTAYIAQVMNGHAHLSQEQAESINEVLSHDETESEFFLLLVQLARAGTEKLRIRIRRRMESIRTGQLNLKERFQATTELGEKELYEFFGRWYVNAIHIGATIPRLKSRKALRHALGIEEALLNEALDFLIRKELLTETNGKLEPGNSRIFIGKDSLILRVHHANWRNKAIEALDYTDPKDLHFTSIYSLSTKDASAIREQLIREIEAVRKTVKNSPEEELHAFTMDFFRLDRN
jgi:uncharacterized protein (TIGR02147 family)